MTYRRFIICFVTAALLLSGAPAARAEAKAAKHKKAAPPNPEAVATAFRAFCEEWMHKLAERERNNLAHLKWDKTAEGVEAAYVGYDQNHTCKLVDGTEADPVAKVFYREVHYVKRGGTVAEA